MDKRKITAIAAIIVAIAAFVAALYYANHDRPVYHSRNTSGIEYEVAKVTGILDDNTTRDGSTGLLMGTKTMQLKILTGRYKGETVTVDNYFSALYNVDVSQGDKVSVRIDTSDSGHSVSIYNYYRVPQLIICVLFFILLLVLIGGRQGGKSAVGLIFTMICIIWLLLPLTLKGFSPLLLTIGIVAICNILHFILITGVNKKTLAATIGSVSGVLAGALFSVIAQAVMSVTTYQMDDAETLLLIASTTKLDIRHLFLCGVLIACMGAVMDVAMSIASAVLELHMVNPELKAKELFKSGMNIGRDAMGTMANTLILAYAGGALNMMLMIYSYGVSFQQLMNTNFVSIELIQSIAGSVGIICTVPISAFVAAFIYGRKNTKK